MKYWLMKSEPDVFSITDLETKKRSGWDGVRNYQARNFMRDQMKVGDLVYFYHSSTEPAGIAGIARVAKESHPDPTQFDKKSEYYDPKAKPDQPIWFMVEVEFVEDFPIVPLSALKANPALKEMQLLQKGSRLSVMPVTQEHWAAVQKMRS